jgi:starch synthase
MDNPLRVLFATSEAVPFAKTGGLADVAGALPKFLKPLGCDITVVMPYYRMVKKAGLSLQSLGEELQIQIGRASCRERV